MKPGDLVRFNYMYSIVRKEMKLGIWLSSRFTRWSDKIPLHRVLIDEGIVEFAAKESDFEVLT